MSMGLQEKIIQLEAKLAQRERETTELMDDYEARLQEHGEVDETKEGHRDIGEFSLLVWNFAQFRFFLLLLWTWMWIFFRAAPWPIWKAAPLALVGAWLCQTWCSAEIDETGWVG